jgi:tRNA (guanine37-N1)-methyltransferase
MSGHHEAIRRWRLKQSLGRTFLRRPDLLQQRRLNEEECRLLVEFRREFTLDQAVQEQASAEKNRSGNAGKEKI